MKSNMVALICPKCHVSIGSGDGKYACSDCMCIYEIHDDIPLFSPTYAGEDSFNEENFELLFGMEKRHFWHLGRREIIYALLRRIYGARLTDVNMMEIGCGNGSVLQFLKSKGVSIEDGDLFLEALQFCRRRLGVPLYQLDACNIPFADEQYDIVGLFDVIEHIDDDEAVLKEAYRICKPGGRIILTVPANKWLWSYFDIISCHKRRYGKKELCGRLQCADFVVEKISFYVSFLFPIFFLYRTVENMRSASNYKELSSRTEVKTIPLVNAIFLEFLRLEKSLIRYINLPIGTSLLAIARKT